MIAEFLQDIDSFERLRVVTTQKSLYLRRLDEQPVQFQLKVRRATEDDLLVFDRNCLRIQKSVNCEGPIEPKDMTHGIWREGRSCAG